MDVALLMGLWLVILMVSNAYWYGRGLVDGERAELERIK